MKLSKEGRELLKELEGVRHKAYQCDAGVWTIGVGHTKGVKQGDLATEEQVDQWLSEDVEESEEIVAKKVKVPLSQAQFDALVCFVFNIGHVGIDMLKLLNRGNFKGAAKEFPKFNKVKGKFNQGVYNRRLKEQSLFNREELVHA